MNYFKTSNATRIFQAGGKSIKFEPVALISSSWLGVYQTEDEAVIEGLRPQTPALTEIAETEYLELKKKEKKFTEQRVNPATSQPAKKEENVAVVLKHEIKLGKASYKDSLDKD